MAVIQLFGREAARGGELRELSERYRQAQFRRVGLESALYAVAEAFGAIVVAALLWWGGLEILDGTLTFGVLVAFMQYTQRFYLPIRDASAKFSVMQAATVAAERVFALLDTPVETDGTARPGAEPTSTPDAVAGASVFSRSSSVSGARPPALEFRDVWFAYPGAGQEGEEDVGRRGRPHPRLGASRRLAPDRDRRARGGGRRHRGREDDARPAPDTDLRRAARRGAGRRHRCAGVGPDRAPAARRARAPGRGAVRRHGRGESRARARPAALDDRECRPTGPRRRVHPLARGRIRRSDCSSAARTSRTASVSSFRWPERSCIIPPFWSSTKPRRALTLRPSTCCKTLSTSC